MNETQFKTKVMAYLKKTYKGCHIYKTCDRFTVGVPDLICCINGRYVAIELKVGYNKATPMQIRNIKKIRAAGGVAGVAWNMDDVVGILKEVD